MAKKLGSLLGRLGRRQAKQDGAAGDGPTTPDPFARDDAPLELPVLMPAVIFRQLIFDATEVTPVWARPRPAAAPEPMVAAAPPEGTKPAKKPRRKNATGASATSRPRTKRAAKPERGPAET